MRAATDLVSLEHAFDVPGRPRAGPTCYGVSSTIWLADATTPDRDLDERCHAGPQEGGRRDPHRGSAKSSLVALIATHHVHFRGRPGILTIVAAYGGNAHGWPSTHADDRR